MKKTDLITAVHTVKSETRTALQTMYAELNQGQQKKIVKNEAVKTLFDRYGVEYTEWWKSQRTVKSVHMLTVVKLVTMVVVSAFTIEELK